jgi:hypothetical protein
MTSLLQRNAMTLLRTICLLLAIGSLSGCAPSFEAQRYFRHTLTVESNGVRIVLTHFFSCRKRYVLSPVDLKFHPDWIVTGNGTVTSDIGDGRILIYHVQGDCKSDRMVRDDSMRAKGAARVNVYDPHIDVLDRSKNPHVLFELIGSYSGIKSNPGDFPVRVVQETVEKLDNSTLWRGASLGEIALENKIRSSEHGFCRIDVMVFPPEVWDTSQAAHEYFAKFTTVAIAKVGEAPPKDGWPDRWIQFPFAYQRNYGKSMNVYNVGSTRSNGQQFEYNETPPSGPAEWFGRSQPVAPDDLTNGHVTVTYKGVSFDVPDSREIFDPETGNIIKFSRSVLDRTQDL